MCVGASFGQFVRLRTQWSLRLPFEKKNVYVCAACVFSGGNNTAEREWLRQKLRSYAVHISGRKKPKFQYKLPLVGDVCRSAWILCAGFPGRKNARIAILEAEIRNPSLRTQRIQKKTLDSNNCNHAISRSQFATAFLEEFILQNSQRSPSSTEL